MKHYDWVFGSVEGYFWSIGEGRRSSRGINWKMVLETSILRRKLADPTCIHSCGRVGWRVYFVCCYLWCQLFIGRSTDCAFESYTLALCVVIGRNQVGQYLVMSCLTVNCTFFEFTSSLLPVYFINNHHLSWSALFHLLPPSGFSSECEWSIIWVSKSGNAHAYIRENGNDEHHLVCSEYPVFGEPLSTCSATAYATVPLAWKKGSIMTDARNPSAGKSSLMTHARVQGAKSVS